MDQSKFELAPRGNAEASYHTRMMQPADHNAMSMVRELLLSSIAMTAALAAVRVVEAAELRYPWKPIRIVVN